MSIQPPTTAETKTSARAMTVPAETQGSPAQPLTHPPMVTTRPGSEQTVRAHAAALDQAGNAGQTGRSTLVQLQRLYGNRYVQRLVAQSSERPTRLIQPKLMLGPVDDPYEREADRVARAVVQRMAASTPAQQDEQSQSLITPGTVQRSALAQGGAVDSQTEAAIESQRGQGQPLAADVRSAMEGAFGVDFSGVQVHTDGAADALNQTLQARAFTTGQDIFFRQGEYQPGGNGGRELIAHELSHVVQQNRMISSSHGLLRGEICNTHNNYIQRDTRSQANANRRSTRNLRQRRSRQVSPHTGKDSETDIPARLLLQQNVATLSGYYEAETRSNGHSKLISLHLHVNHLTLDGTYRVCENKGSGYEVTSSGYIHANRDDSEGAISYNPSNASTVSWIFQFGATVANEWTGFARVPLLVTDSNEEEIFFRRKALGQPIMEQDINNAPVSNREILQLEQRYGLTPTMVEKLNSGAEELLTLMRANSESGLSVQNDLFRKDLAESYMNIISEYSGQLRIRADNYLRDHLSRNTVRYLGESLRADQAIHEALTNQNLSPEPLCHDGDGKYHYEITFSGLRAEGGALVTLGGAIGAVHVRAYRYGGISHKAWERSYGFIEGRISSTGGERISGGLKWKTFHPTSSVEWTQRDFENAQIGIVTVAGPNATVSANAGPINVNLGSATVYQIEQIFLRTDSKTLQLSSEEQVASVSSSLIDETPAIERPRQPRPRNEEGGLGVDHQEELGHIETGLGILMGMPNQEYSSERQQYYRRLSERQIHIRPSTMNAGFAISSSQLTRSMSEKIAHELNAVREQIRNPSVPVRIIGHASSFWRGHPTRAIAGNLALSRSRAEHVASLIRDIFELSPDRIFDIMGMGDQLHRGVGGTVADDDPAYRRVDIIIQGSREIHVYY